MKTSTMLLAGAAFLLLARSSRAARVHQATAGYLNNPTNWGADQWSRIYGDDLSQAGLKHDSQSGLTAYGFQNAIGFSLVGDPRSGPT